MIFYSVLITKEKVTQFVKVDIFKTIENISFKRYMVLVYQMSKNIL